MGAGDRGRSAPFVELPHGQQADKPPWKCSDPPLFGDFTSESGDDLRKHRTTTKYTMPAADSCTRPQASFKQFIAPAAAVEVNSDIWTAHGAWNANQQQDMKTKEFAIIPLYTAD